VIKGRYDYLSKLSLVIIAGCLLTIVCVEYLQPLIGKTLYSQQYQKLSIDCDNAMHNEVALREGTVPSSETPLLSKTAEIELMVCHEYDKTRKKMLVMGVTDNYLSYLTLLALETEKIPVSKMVEPHRMDHF